MTNASDGTVLCWQLVVGAFNKVDLSQVRDAEWVARSSVYSWETMGIWSKTLLEYAIARGLRENDINSISISSDRQLIAVGDQQGPPRVYYYPAS